MFNPGQGPTSSSSSTSSQDNKSIMFTCNLDSLDSVGELVRKVYTTVTPRCLNYTAKIRRYGTKEQNNIIHLITLPKTLLEQLFGKNVSKEVFDKGTLDITYFYDRNMLKKLDKINNKEEMFVLLKITKQRQ